MPKYYHIPKIWEGETCFIIGGGASILSQFNIPKDVVKEVTKGTLPMSAYSPFMEVLHDKNVIAVNSAYKLGDWVDITYFSDKPFYLHNRVDLFMSASMKISSLEYAENSDWVTITQVVGVMQLI